jgi:hypothetical protein
VGITEAKRLQYFTNYQNVYTTLQQQIPTFTKDQAGPIGGGKDSNSDQAQTRNELNSTFNGALIDNIRNLRSVQQNNAQQVQTGVNTTNDAVNQQTDMATTFIQQLSTLLSTIYK